MDLERSFLNDRSEQRPSSPLADISQKDHPTTSPLLSNHEARASEREHKTSPTVFELKEETQRKKHNSQWGWWWECASQLLSISCTAIAIAILIYMNNKPLSHWKLPIAPNSLIAIFSTIAKSALIYPISECIGQLKWHYFEKSRMLRDIEEFDRATRGPWGATTFIARQGRYAGFTTLGAFIIILVLAFEPFTQQVISFSTALVPIPNVGEFVSKINIMNVIDTMFDQDNMQWDIDFGFPMQIGMVDVTAHPEGGTLSIGSKNVHCPTAKCRYDDFTSFAACGKCESKAIHNDDFNCTGHIYDGITNSSLEFSSFDQFKEQLLQETSEEVKFKLNCSLNFDDENKKWNFPKFAPWTASYNFSYHNSSFSGEVHQPICVNMLDGQEESAWQSNEYISLDHGWPSMTTFSCYSSAVDQTILRVIDDFQSNGTAYLCALDYCAKKYSGNSYSNGTFRSEQTTIIPLNVSILKNDTGFNFDASNEKEQFFLGRHDAIVAQAVVTNLLQFYNIYFYLMNFLSQTNGNFTKLFTGYADVISAVLQNPLNSDAIKITGDTFETEVWVTVRWGWFILPLFLVAASTAFFLSTLLFSHNKTYLFKTHLIPSLVLGSNDIGGGAIALGLNRNVQHGDLQDRYGKIRVQLIQDPEGDLRLKVD